MTRNKLPFYCTAALGALAMVVLAGLRPDDTEKFLFTDNFNDNSISPTWAAGSFGGKHVAETSQRLQFSANGSTGQFSFAGLGIAPWGANIKRDFEVEMDTTLNLTNVTAPRLVFLGFGFANDGDGAEFPATGTVLGAGVLRDSSGLHVGWIKLQDGDLVDFAGDTITQVSGKLTVEFDKGNNELRIKRNGHTVVYDGFYNDFGPPHATSPLAISVGCVTGNGDISFPGSKARVDNFQFSGFKRPRS